MFFLQNNFNGGIVTPWVDTRGDLRTFKSSLRTCENFICSPYGGLRRRFGTDFVASSSGKSRLLGYQRSSNEGYMLEFGDRYLRVHQNGKRIAGVHVASPWSSIEVFDLQYVKLNNVMFFTHKNHPPYQLRFNSSSSWDLRKMDFDHPAFKDYTFDGAMRVMADTSVPSNIDSSFDTAKTTSEVASNLLLVRNSWSVVVNTLNFTQAVAPDPAPASHLKIQTSTDGGNTWIDAKNVTETGTYTGSLTYGYLRIVALEAEVHSTMSSSNAVQALSKGDSVIVRSTKDFFSNKNIGSEILIEHSPEETEVRLPLTASGTSEWVTAQGGWSLFTSGNYTGDLIIQRSTDNGATYKQELLRQANGDRRLNENHEVIEKTLLRIKFIKKGAPANNPYATIQTDGSNIKGRVLITDLNSATEVKGVVVAGIYSSVNTDLWRESSWSNAAGYPAAITWHEGRLWFGGTNAEPSTLWASKSDDFFNFEYGTNDDEGFSRLMGTTELTDIVWLASQGGLFIGTSGEEWKGNSDSDSGVITPGSFLLRRISNSGSDPIAPVFSGAQLIHVKRQGGSVVQIGYNAASSTESGFSPIDLNLTSPHITRGGVTTLANQAIRDKIVWATTGEGKLIGLTFEPSQQVAGWHTHNTAGSFESVATVYESGKEDSVYVQVKRNGSYMVERFFTEQYASIENKSDYLFTDSSIRYSGASTTSISGLNHLEGMAIQVVSNDRLVSETVVSGGSITLTSPVTECSVGVGYASVFETLPFLFDMQDGSSVGRFKRVSDVILRVYGSVTCHAACTSGGAYKWEEMRQSWRQQNDLGLLEAENSIGHLEDWAFPLSSGNDTDARIAVRITEPYPLNILSTLANLTVAS